MLGFAKVFEKKIFHEISPKVSEFLFFAKMKIRVFISTLQVTTAISGRSEARSLEYKGLMFRKKYSSATTCRLELRKRKQTKTFKKQ
jgi:hypothetical protein